MCTLHFSAPFARHSTLLIDSTVFVFTESMTVLLILMCVCTFFFHFQWYYRSIFFPMMLLLPFSQSSSSARMDLIWMQLKESTTMEYFFLLTKENFVFNRIYKGRLHFWFFLSFSVRFFLFFFFPKDKSQSFLLFIYSFESVVRPFQPNTKLKSMSHPWTVINAFYLHLYDFTSFFPLVSPLQIQIIHRSQIKKKKK